MKYVASKFFCTRCGKEGIIIPRKIGSQREPGHLKKLYCCNCSDYVNHVEIKEFNQRYDYDTFVMEFEYGNFNDKGKRILNFNKFKELVNKGEKIKVKELK